MNSTTFASALSFLYENGAVFLPSYFTSDQVSALKEGIRYDNTLHSPFKANIRKGSGPGMATNIWRTKDVSQFGEFCTSGELIRLLCKVFDHQPFRFLQDTWFYRPKDCIVSIPWHHDNIVIGDHFSIWVSLTEHKIDDSLTFVSGSHHDGINYMPSTYFSEEQGAISDIDKYYASYNLASSQHLKETFAPVPSEEELRNKRDILRWPTSPGDCIIFNSRTLHSLPSSCGDYERTAFVSRWIADGSTVALHADDTVKAIRDAGLAINLSVGDTIKGEQFPLYT